MVDTMNLRCEIFDMLRDHIGANIAKRVSNVVDVLKLAAQVEDFPPVTDRIALANGTLYLDGTFQEGKSEIVRNRLPVKYDLKAVQPVHWLQFLSDLLYMARFRSFAAYVRTENAACCVRTYAEKRSSSPL
jgi:putative DNA primase/helicase